MTYTGSLPKFAAVHRDHTIELDDGVYVVFQIVAIPGTRMTQILDAHRSEEGTVLREDIGPDVLEAGIGKFYSSVESTPVEFTASDAAEVWETWPDWARAELYVAVETYSTRGPVADPKGGSTRNVNGGS
jgi:hypothetical protein